MSTNAELSEDEKDALKGLTEKEVAEMLSRRQRTGRSILELMKTRQRNRRTIRGLRIGKEQGDLPDFD